MIKFDFSFLVCFTVNFRWLLCHISVLEQQGKYVTIFFLIMISTWFYFAQTAEIQSAMQKSERSRLGSRHSKSGISSYHDLRKMLSPSVTSFRSQSPDTF